MNRTAMAESIKGRFKELGEPKLEGIFTVVQYDGMPSKKPVGDDSWAKVMISWGTRVKRSVGGLKSRYRTPGSLVVSLFVPIDRGDLDIFTACDSISPHFQDVLADSIEWQTPSAFRVGRAGNWFQYNLVCPFYSDEVE